MGKGRSDEPYLSLQSGGPSAGDGAIPKEEYGAIPAGTDDLPSFESSLSSHAWLMVVAYFAVGVLFFSLAEDFSSFRGFRHLLLDLLSVM